MTRISFSDDGYGDYWDAVIESTEKLDLRSKESVYAEVSFYHAVQRYDIDASGMCSPAALWRWFEEAEGALLERVGLEPGFCFRLLVVHQEMDYRRRLRHADEVEIRLAIAGVGRSTVCYRLRAEHDGQICMSGRTVRVLVDPATGGCQPWPDMVRTLLTRSPDSDDRAR